MTGYDLDGVICPNWEPIWMKPIWKIAPMLASKITARKKLGFKPLRIPQKGAVIITGRGGQLQWLTVEWLRRNGITNRLYMTDHPHTDHELAVFYKAHMIKKLGVTKYFEDDVFTADLLEDITKVVRV